MKYAFTLVLSLAVTPLLAGQTLKDPNAAKLRSDTHSTPKATVNFGAPRRVHAATRPQQPHHLSSDRQLSAMQRQTERIVAGKASPKPKATSNRGYVQPKPEPQASGGFDATPYLQKRKSMTVTNHAQRGPSRSPLLHGAGR